MTNLTIVKEISNKTYKDKKGNQRHYENYKIVFETENGNKITIPFTPNYNLDKNVFVNLKHIEKVVDKRDAK